MTNLACNHLFYHPSTKEILTPDRIGVSYSRFQIPSTEDVSLAAWLLQAEVPRQPSSLIIHLHGNAENMSSHFLFAAWLVDEGFDVLTFDYRGYGSSTAAAPKQKDLIEDTLSVFEWVSRQEDLKERKIYVLAQSLGGAIVFPAIRRWSKADQIRGLAVDSSFGSYREIVRKKLSGIWLTWPLQYPLSYLVSDYEVPQLAAREVKVPSIFFHSPSDPVVPYRSGWELYQNAGGEKQFVDVEIPGHTTAFARDESPYREMLVKFFKEH